MRTEKRPCKVCGQTHVGCPFTDCFSGNENELPDSLQDGYRARFGDDEHEN